MPWVALGVLLLVMSMMGFALWSVSQAQRTPVLVAASPIAAGDEIGQDDLILVPVGADAGLSLVTRDQAELVVGQIARGPIPAGTPLSVALVISPAEVVPAGHAVVGASLAPGEYPTAALRAGDRVRLVETTGALSGPVPTTGEDNADPTLGDATVWTAEPLTDTVSRELFVSLLVTEAEAARVADVAARGQLRLLLIGSG